jgi:uncharacterized membrane protein YkvA (DUF1232 family)
MSTHKPIKITFALDEKDAAYFRGLYQEAKKNAANLNPSSVTESARGLISRVRSGKKVPNFVTEAIGTLETLMEMLEDKDYALPKGEAAAVLAALAYFSNPQDLIPDDVPGLGFLDDAIMIKLVDEEFEHELWAYRKFRKLVDGMEQRPWTEVAQQRRPGRIAEFREQVRAEISKRKTRRRFLW